MEKMFENKANYNSKSINSKRIHLILGLDNFETLKAVAKIKNTTMTGLIENFLESLRDVNKLNPIIQDLEQYENKRDIKLKEKLKSIDEHFKYIKDLINFNKDFYLDLNATFSNINQIAHRLNIANLNNEENELINIINDKTFQENVSNQLNETKAQLNSLRELMQVIMKNLEKNDIKVKRKIREITQKTTKNYDK